MHANPEKQIVRFKGIKENLHKWWEFAQKLSLGIAQKDNALFQKSIMIDGISKIDSFASRSEQNGWIIPDEWSVKKCSIKDTHGNEIYDGLENPLAVAAYSSSFEGVLKKEQYNNHFYTSLEKPNSIPFHFLFRYKPWLNEWAICMPQAIRDEIEYNSEVSIELITEKVPGKMHTLEYSHEGQSSKTYYFNAHDCHPCQFEDGPAGMVIIWELFNWLKGRKTKYSYKALIAPEIIGSSYYLMNLPKQDVNNIEACLFLEMLGLNHRYSIQQSVKENSIYERAIQHILSLREEEYGLFGFRECVGNDEILWESPGFSIPCPSLTRVRGGGIFPHYDEYHTAADKIYEYTEKSIISTLDLLKEVITIIENNVVPQVTCRGIPCLSNPKIDLYKTNYDPTVNKDKNTVFHKRISRMQMKIFHDLQKGLDVLDLAILYQLPFNEVFNFIKKLEEFNFVITAEI
tara:strand:- start:3004 stop:4380 length:1377 start_codon:yes stop_codon:yes gene_type:complete